MPGCFVTLVSGKMCNTLNLAAAVEDYISAETRKQATVCTGLKNWTNFAAIIRAVMKTKGGPT